MERSQNSESGEDMATAGLERRTKHASTQKDSAGSAQSNGRPPKMIYYFGKTKTEGRGEQKDLLGGKGANLADMTSIGLPVPPGFTITTEVCDLYYKNGKQASRRPDGRRAQERRHAGEGDRQEVRRRDRTRCWSRSARAPRSRCPA